MAITSKATLLAAAADALDRTDFTARLATSLPLAESWLNRNVRMRLMESDEALTTTPDSATVALPSGFLEPLSLTLDDSDGSHPLQMIGAGQGAYEISGRPASYWIDGANIVFDRPCDAAYSLTLHMLERFALDADGDTNALLTAWPDLYLSALLVAVTGVYLTDDPRLAAWKYTRDELLSEVNRKEARARKNAELRADPALLQRARFPYTHTISGL